MLAKTTLHNKLGRVKLALLLIPVLFSFAACQTMSDSAPPSGAADAEPLTAMTYNLYVGASMTELIGITNRMEVPAAVADVYAMTKAADFNERVAGVVASVKAHKPHIIGLQEVSLIRTQSPGDRLSGGLHAEDVAFDFREILTDALQAEGLNYQVAAQIQNFDVEMPMRVDGGLDDIRLTDFDVILTRDDVAVSRPDEANYESVFSVDALQVSAPRGYAAIDAVVSGTKYRVVNTHLESFDKDIRVAQTRELIDALRDEPLPIILLGDFNSPAPDGSAYQMLLSAGYQDVWQAESAGAGATCCQASDLKNETSELNDRIDQIFTRNFERAVSDMTQTVGDRPSDRLPSGLWPSDHAGVVAYIASE